MIDKRILAGVSLAALAFATPSLAQTLVSEPDGPDGPTSLEDVVVFGRGSARQQSSITDEAIAIEVPGTSPLKAIERLPGVSFQSSDSQGNYEWSTRIVLRGFSQSQLGFTLDGVPLGDMSYGNHNGLHISRAIISENLGRVDVAQGSGSLGTASSSNLGGTLQFVSRRPSEDFGIDVAGVIGSEQTYRGFVRIDSGALGSAGTRLSASYADQQGDHWKGWGDLNSRQLNLNLYHPAGRGSISAFLDLSERREKDQQDLSLEQIDRLGRNWDNVINDYATAVTNAAIYQANPNRDCAQGNGSGPLAGTNPYVGGWDCIDDAYYDSTTLRDDILGGVTVDYPLTDRLNVSVSGYFHDNRGMGGWWTPYQATTAGARDQNGVVIANPSPISVRTTEYDIERFGFFGSARYEFGSHMLEAGFWVEDNHFVQARRFYGLSRTESLAEPYEFYENPFLTQWQYAFDTRTVMAYVQDTWDITDTVTLNFGFKSLSAENVAETLVGPDKTGSIKAEDNFLPQVGLTWDVTPDHELFASYTENIRAYESSATGGPFSATAVGFRALQRTIRPETAASIEAGWRFRFDRLQGTVALYDVKFENRLLSVALGSSIQGLGNGIQNVGSVTSRGFEVAGLWNFTDTVSGFVSYSYNDSTYDDNVRDGAGNVVATAGKTLVNIPNALARAELSYDNGAFFTTLAAAYTGERYSSYLNDESADAFLLGELTAGYRFTSGGSWLNGTQVQLNVTNLLDTDFIATVGSGGFQNDAGRQTFLPGAPRQVFVSVRRRF
ncbi:TonB-dependent receptor [Brevundimonas kwangchunensis]|uniref:TonB-dependent receptor n=1 Tax=Brevundimonas kwangchunensis TaxID=322163 RepID=A0ABP3S207_9CAUL